MFPICIDNTTIEAYKACPRKGQIQAILRRTPNETSTHLHAGAAYAEALKTYRDSYYDDNLPLDAAKARGATALIRNYGSFVPPSYGSASLKNLPSMLYLFWHHTNPDFGGYDPARDPLIPHRHPSGKLMTEFSFAEPLPILHPDTGEPLLYVGRCDMIASYANALWVVDDKTTSRLGDSWASSWSLRGQFLGYCWAAAKAGFPVVGAIANGHAIYKAKPPAYVRIPALFSSYLIDRWFDDTLYYITRMIQDYLNYSTAPWPHRYGDACTSYGGCDFKKACEGGRMEDKILKLDYTISTWSPLDPLNEDF